MTVAPAGPRAERGALRELGLLGGGEEDGEDAGAAAAAAPGRGEDPGAVGEAELKRAYRQLALRWHPDKQARGGAAERVVRRRGGTLTFFRWSSCVFPGCFSSACRVMLPDSLSAFAPGVLDLVEWSVATESMMVDVSL